MDSTEPMFCRGFLVVRCLLPRVSGNMRPEAPQWARRALLGDSSPFFRDAVSAVYRGRGPLMGGQNMTGALLPGASEFTVAQSTTLDAGIARPDALDGILKSRPTQFRSSVTQLTLLL